MFVVAVFYSICVDSLVATLVLLSSDDPSSLILFTWFWSGRVTWVAPDIPVIVGRSYRRGIVPANIVFNCQSVEFDDYIP